MIRASTGARATILQLGALGRTCVPGRNGRVESLSGAWLYPIIIVAGGLQAGRPLPTVEGTAGMPWWAPLGGIIGAFAGPSISS